MKLIFSTILSFLLVITSLVAQSPVPQVILDVKASGFKIEPEGEHCYLRVYDNGEFGFDDYKKSINAFYLYESRLSREQLALLQSQLQSASALGTDSSYPFTSPLRQIVTEVKITIPRPNGFQTIKIERGSSAGSASNLKALHTLVCTIEGLRGKRVFRLIDMKACEQVGQ